MSHHRFDRSVAPIAIASRSGVDESVHHGVGVVLDADGAVAASVGEPELVVYPRSCLKPLQADAMIGCGLALPPDLLAVACASHNGESAHLDAVKRILALHDLDETLLRNTASYPLDDAANLAARAAGRAPSSLEQNCSGKHAAMLATCRLNGWSLDDYLDTEHPLQRAISTRVDELIGPGDDHDPTVVTHTGVDGCGAPAHMFSLLGLARAFGALARTGSDVARAMSAHPHLVAGTGRDVTTWMAAVPGMIAKEGAAGVMAAALPDGRAFAFKIADGSQDARQAVTIEAMRMLGPGPDLPAWDETVAAVAVPVLGHGRRVGELAALRWA